MEEFFIVMLQMLLEMAVDIFCYTGFDWPGFDSGSKDENFICWLMIFLILGAVIGMASVWLFPTLLIKIGALQMINLLLCPALSGLTAWKLARWRQRHDSKIVPWMHGIYGTVFALSYIGVRFTLGTR